MDILAFVIGLLIGVLVGCILVGWWLHQRGRGQSLADLALREARHQTELAEIRATDEAAQSLLRAEVAAGHATIAGLREQVIATQQQQRELIEQHRAEQRGREAREHAESRVLQALAPVQQSLTDMRAKVADLESQRNLQHGELTQQLKSAVESEERLRSTAEALASALRSNSTRGVWGETQLRSVVEAAGLLERVDFDLQPSISSDSGAGRPDMVVRLPGGKSIAVDAKAPFNAFLEASQIQATAVGAESARRSDLMKQHVQAVRAHIASLASKSYWNGLDASPELVIAFIPSESLVAAALEADPSIMEFAFSKRVALASPVTLWSMLKTVAFSWQQDVLTNEAKTLFDLSRELYSRLATTASHIEKLGRTIERSVKDYNSLVGSLERQVLPTARKLAALDESKVLAPLQGVEEAPRKLTAYELVSDPGADLNPEIPDLAASDSALGPVRI